jgi:hypothetical protein
MDSSPGSAYRYAPDGLVGTALDDLIARAYAEVANAPVPTSALLDGSAAEQRRRRVERRPVATGCVGLAGRSASTWISAVAPLSYLAHVVIW